MWAVVHTVCSDVDAMMCAVRSGCPTQCISLTPHHRPHTRSLTRVPRVPTCDCHYPLRGFLSSVQGRRGAPDPHFTEGSTSSTQWAARVEPGGWQRHKAVPAATGRKEKSARGGWGVGRGSVYPRSYPSRLGRGGGGGGWTSVTPCRHKPGFGRHYLQCSDYN